MDPFTPKYDLSMLPTTIRKAATLGMDLTIRDHVRNTMRTSDFVLCVTCDDIEQYAPHVFLSEKAYLSLKRNRYGEKIEEMDEKGREYLYNVYYHNEGNRKVENVELLIIAKVELHLYRVVGCYRYPYCPVCMNRDTFLRIRNFLYRHNKEAYQRIKYPRVMKNQLFYIQ